MSCKLFISIRLSLYPAWLSFHYVINFTLIEPFNFNIIAFQVTITYYISLHNHYFDFICILICESFHLILCTVHVNLFL